MAWERQMSVFKGVAPGKITIRSCLKNGYQREEEKISRKPLKSLALTRQPIPMGNRSKLSHSFGGHLVVAPSIPANLQAR